MSRVRKALAPVATFVRMANRDRVEVLVDVVLLARIELWLRRRRLPDITARLGVDLGSDLVGVSPRPMRTPLPDWAMRRLYYANQVVERWPFGRTCLRRSLLAGTRLRSLHPTLRIGVRFPGENPKLAAHAWLEIDGEYFDAGAADYLILGRAP